MTFCDSVCVMFSCFNAFCTNPNPNPNPDRFAHFGLHASTSAHIWESRNPPAGAQVQLEVPTGVLLQHLLHPPPPYAPDGDHRDPRGVPRRAGQGRAGQGRAQGGGAAVHVRAARELTYLRSTTNANLSTIVLVDCGHFGGPNSQSAPGQSELQAGRGGGGGMGAALK